MPSTTNQRKRMPAEQRRLALLDIARREFSSHGYRATTTLGIAERAGVSEGLVLKHFGSKDELFRAAVADPLLDMLREQIAQGAEVTAALESEAERLQEFLTRFARVVQEEGPLLLALLGNLKDFPDVGAELATLVRQLVDDVASEIGERAGRDEYRQFDASVATYAGLAAASIGGLVAEDPDAFIREVVDLIMVGVLSPTGRRRYRSRTLP
jgi:AcrR family transcriptional regulator